MCLKKIIVIMAAVCVMQISAQADENVVLSYDIPMCEDDQNSLYEYCNDYSVPYEIALGVIETESTFNNDAVNWNGTCYGYMQINLCNENWLWREIEVENITQADQNLKSGIYMLSELYDKYEDWHCALICYNCGEPVAKDYYFGRGVYSSEYSCNVMQSAQKWAKILYE